MGTVVRDTSAMIAGMAPKLDLETYVFASVTNPLPDHITPLASFTEDEGLSVILTLRTAQDMALNTDIPMRRITLSVHSALNGVGLTAAVASTLADNGIACNMVAGFHHDHAFGPAEDAEQAMQLLKARAQEATT